MSNAAHIKLVCPTCRVYNRVEQSDGHNSYTVCAYCGRSDLLIARNAMQPGDPDTGHEWTCSKCGRPDDPMALVVRSGKVLHPACEAASDDIDRIPPSTSRARGTDR